MKSLLLRALLAVLFLWSGLTAAPVEFVAEVAGVEEIDGITVLSVRITPAVSIEVKVGDLTEIKDETGFPISAAELSAGQLVEIEGLFTDQGILALEIKVLDRQTDFELRGQLDEIGVERVTLLGLVIEVPDSAEIKDELGNPVTLDQLNVGDLVKVEGTTDGDSLVADEIKKVAADSFARISFLGVIEAFPADDQLTVVLDGDVRVLVELTEETDVKGTLSPGATVRVIGLINSDLFVTALKVKIISAAVELSPGRLKLGLEEARRVEVILEEALDEDLTIVLTSQNPEIADPTPTEVVIAEGELAGAFEVSSHSIEGVTQIEAFLTELDVTLLLRVDVKEGGAGDGELELKWTPQVIRSDPQTVRVVSLLLKKGVAPADLTIPLTLLEGPETLVTFPESATIPQGENRVRFEVELLSQPGMAVIRAELPEDLGGSTADLVVELGPGQRKVKVQFLPDRVKVGPLMDVEVSLELSQPAPFPVTLELAPRNGDPGVVNGFPSEVTIAEGDQTAIIHFSTSEKEGRVTFRATMPDALGRGHDDLKVTVKN